ncbi:uncharacterized protein N7511_003430 [Penicillium nucicola]|uniref:uncharacterized protein n=1 Tax=Penicillium nucicola TaxID=1850975 RepID=UPI0025452A45|nr:uncharacterized protein N7511_003430 [Penicillium nucicola]KAJ5771379.1 hypothetical protein N7511_003430 [Penicillium nucicola]
MHRPSFLALVALFLAVTQSATSYPIFTDRSGEANQLEETKAPGLWQSVGKEGLDLLPEPPKTKYSLIPSWSNNRNGQTSQRGPAHPHPYQTSPVLVPATLDILSEQMHKHYNSHLKDKQEHKSKYMSAAEQRQNHYSELLSYLHAKNALNKDPNHSTPASFSLASSAGHSVSFFSYRLSWPALGSSTTNMPRYPLPGIFTTVIVLLAMVWIAIFTIGLVELANFVWERRKEAEEAQEEEDYEHGEEGSVRLNSLKSVPFTVVFPSNRLRSISEREEEEYPVAVFSDADLSAVTDADHLLI